MVSVLRVWSTRVTRITITVCGRNDRKNGRADCERGVLTKKGTRHGVDSKIGRWEKLKGYMSKRRR